MSRSQYWLPTLRWGRRMRDGVTIDAMVGALTGRYALVTMCIGGGQGIAAIFERM